MFKNRIGNMDKDFWFNILLLLLILLILGYGVPLAITGFGFTQISLSIKNVTKGEITAFNYETLVNVSETQTIFVEFTNTGTTSYTAKIEIFVYIYEDMKLDEVAYYYDTTAFIASGMGRTFTANFIPFKMGFYYIKVKVSYDVKITESWGSFYAIHPGYTPVTPIVEPVVKHIPAQPVGLSLEYPEEVNLSQGQSALTSILLKNTGNTTLNDIKLYVSATNLLNIEVNPKQIYLLYPDKTSIFLISIDAPPDIPVLKYPLDFEVISDELKKTGTISVNIIPYNITLEEWVQKTILNYEYLITELEREILEAYLADVNVTLAENILDEAKINLQAAKNYYQIENYEKAKEKLDETKENLKDCVFQLAQASFRVFVAPAFSPIWILIIAILIALIFLFLIKRREKKKKRPKLLKTVEEAET